MKRNLIPINIGNYFEVRNSNPNNRYNLRHREGRTETINCRTGYGQKSIQFREPLAWNDIPENIASCDTISSFKKQLKLHLLESQYTGETVSL